MTERIRYAPGEVLRWIDDSRPDGLDEAKRKGRSLFQREGERTLGRDLRDAAGMVLGVGKSALAQLARRQALAQEFSLYEDDFEILSPGAATRRIRYLQVQRISWRAQDRVVLELDRGHVTIKPVAHLVAGKLKVPVGWTRNGLEVPYETLIDEIAARCGLEIERAA